MESVSIFSIIILVVTVAIIGSGFLVNLQGKRHHNNEKIKKGSDIINFGLYILFIGTIFVIIRLIV